MQEQTQTTTRTFKELSLHDCIQEALEDAHLTHLTPIQEQALPLTLTGHDVMGIAQTGTGKTATFLISMLNYLMVNPVHPKAKGPWGLVLAPTRELAIQIKKDCDLLSRYSGLKSIALYGGSAIEPQKKAFAAGDIDIIIGTPGRVIDLFKQRVFRLKNIEVCILDEADRMFDLGFIDDVRYLLRQLPPAHERLNLLFSATMSHKVQELAYEHFNAPKVISITPEKPTAEKVSQTLYHTAKHEKTPLLLGLLAKEQPTRSIIFLNTKKDLERLSKILEINGFANAMLSGDMMQKKREQVIQDFQNGKVGIVIATDVAARGLHIPDITHVFNYDLPHMAEDYVHRIGRTARAGASGKAISFACEEYVYSLPEIEHYLGDKIPVMSFDDDLLADVIPLSDEQIAEMKVAQDEEKKSVRKASGNRRPVRNRKTRSKRKD